MFPAVLEIDAFADVIRGDGLVVCAVPVDNAPLLVELIRRYNAHTALVEACHAAVQDWIVADTHESAGIGLAPHIEQLVKLLDTEVTNAVSD